MLGCISQHGLRVLAVGDCGEDLLAALRRQFPQAQLQLDPKSLKPILASVLSLLEHSQIPLPLALDPVGTPFQRAVWTQLRTVPCGSTLSYGQLAAQLNRPKAVRAVAQACGANPLLLVVPCHRVVGVRGALTGFRAGIARKKWLLDRESAFSA